MKKILLGILMLSVLLVSVGMVSAATSTTLFEDNFDSYDSGSAGDAQLQAAGWGGYYFEYPDYPSSLWHDIEVIDAYYSSPHSVEIEDDAGIYHEVDTTGYENINVAYCIRTYNSYGGDRIKAGWKVGDATDNWDDWEQLDSYIGGEWNCVDHDLPASADNTKIQIAFFLDNGEGNIGKIDDVVVTGIEMEEPKCELNIVNPSVDEYFDSEAVPIEWELTDGCSPIDVFYLMYSTEDCDADTGDWNYVPGTEGGMTQNQVQDALYEYSYLWDRPQESGEYCVKVKVTSNGARDVLDSFFVDLMPPVVSLDAVSTPKVGECLEEQTGDCFVNQNTDITLTCDEATDDVWQSGVKSISYSINGGNPVTINGDSATFSFQEDSNHQIEYWCNDNVGKESEHKFKDFIVDTVGPEITRTVTGDQVCPEGVNDCSEYFNTQTEICISAEDPQPHPVGLDWLSCDYWVNNQKHDIVLDEDGCFNYQEDSWHTLKCYAKDELGNFNDKHWFDVVDDKAPETTLTFEGPYHTESEEYCHYELKKIWHYFHWHWKWVKVCEDISDGVQWIDGVSTVNLAAEDPQPHPVGYVDTYYRYDVVDDEYCWGTNEQDFPGLTGEWVEYTAPFSMEESCHAIEYYSVDGLGNEESVDVEFVFVDKTAPENLMEVGEPSDDVDYAPTWNWYENENQNVEWEVTLDTPVTISCGDVGPHHSGIDSLWYRVVWDGKYNDSSAQWQEADNHEVTIYFNEKSEHLLEFYCVDNVNKTSEPTSTLFKVKGTSFDLSISEKWDLVSVPFQLIGDGAVEDVFGDDGIVEVWSYEDGQWKLYSENTKTLDKIVPGRGYWVRSTEPVEVTIGGELYTEGGGVMPLEGVELYEGWNLIGPYGTAAKTAYCSLFGLGGTDPQQTWTQLLKYDPAVNVQSLIGVPLDENLEPGRGYWILMDEGKVYYPSTMCYSEPYN